MTRITLTLLATWMAVAAQSPGIWLPDRGDGTFKNPVIHADYSDPDVVRVGADYFMTSSSFSAVPGLPILHSRDLVNWRLVNHALPRLVPEAAFATPKHGAGVWAPAIRHHAGRYWIYYPDPDHGIYVTTAADPRGTWSPPRLVKAGKGLIDPCPLWDDDGRVYLIHAFARSRAGFANVLHLNRLTPDGMKTADEGRVIINGDTIPGYTTLEGPKFYKRSGWYYVFAPAGGVKQGWQSVFRSRRIDGPYDERIVLAQGATDINGPHQGALVDTPSGEWWFLHFQDAEAYGRIVHMQPVTWKDDWPVIGDDGDGDGKGEPRRSWKKPALPQARVAIPPTSDDFSSPTLALQWQWQSNPKREWATLTRDGLELSAVPAPSNLWTAGHLLLQKFAAPEFTATVSLDPTRLRPGERAGLIVFGADYAWIGVERTATGTRVVFRVMENAAAGESEREVAASDAPSGPLVFTVAVTQGAVCIFSARALPLGLSFTAKPGRWVGAKVGLFAAAPEGNVQRGSAVFRAFEVH